MNPSLLFSPWVSYDLGGIIPKFGLTYLSAAEVVAGSFSQAGSNLFDNVLNLSAPSLAKTNVNNVALFEIKPSVQFLVNQGQSITFFVYAFDTSVGSDDVYFKDGYGASTAKVNHTVQVSYI